MRTCVECGASLARGRNKSGCCRKCYQLGDRNPNWNNSRPSYSAMHARIGKERGKATEHICACGNQAKEWALIRGEDDQDVMSYTPLCYSCHKRYDGIVNNLPDNSMKVGGRKPECRSKS